MLAPVVRFSMLGGVQGVRISFADEGGKLSCRAGS